VFTRLSAPSLAQRFHAKDGEKKRKKKKDSFKSGFFTTIIFLWSLEATNQRNRRWYLHAIHKFIVYYKSVPMAR